MHRGLVEIDGRPRTLPMWEVATSREFYDNQAKRDALLRTEHCPSVLPEGLIAGMGQLARHVFRLIGAHGVLRVDFLATPGGWVTLLEANTLPGLPPRGNLATMARADGIGYPALIRQLVLSAFTKPAYLP
ncbi:D-alanine--D-alanine ligase family protein [Streptomyces abikoensis]|uniref:hypothetical protein n=1 Tax=Streptomyces abikoensis TaxID=97398 RepID=UPI00368341A0